MKKELKPVKKNVGVATKKKAPQKLAKGGSVKKSPKYM